MNRPLDVLDWSRNHANWLTLSAARDLSRDMEPDTPIINSPASVGLVGMWLDAQPDAALETEWTSPAGTFVYCQSQIDMDYLMSYLLNIGQSDLYYFTFVAHGRHPSLGWRLTTLTYKGSQRDAQRAFGDWSFDQAQGHPEHRTGSPYVWTGQICMLLIEGLRGRD